MPARCDCKSRQRVGTRFSHSARANARADSNVDETAALEPRISCFLNLVRPSLADSPFATTSDNSANSRYAAMAA